MKKAEFGLHNSYCPSIPIFHCVTIGVFSKWNRPFIEFTEFRESDKSLCGAVVESLSLTQEIICSNTAKFLSLNLVKAFRENLVIADLFL